MSDRGGDPPVAGGGGPYTTLAVQALQSISRSVTAQAQALATLLTKTIVLANAAQGASGLFVTPLRLTDFHNTDGSALAAAASAGKFGYSITLGTSVGLVGEGAQGNTKTDDAIIEYVLPPWYKSATNATITVNAKLAGTGVAGTRTAQIKAWRTAADGTQGADLGPGATSNIVAAGGDITFTITGTSLNPDDRLVIELETVVQETGAAATLTAVINSVRIS